MPSTLSKRSASSRHSHLPPFNQACATFAREAAIDAFGPRAIQALDEPGFEDRRPTHEPRPIGKIAAKVTHDTGMKAVRHWLNQAGRADSDEGRDAALKIADEIAQLMGVDINLTSRRAA